MGSSVCVLPIFLARAYPWQRVSGLERALQLESAFERIRDPSYSWSDLQAGNRRGRCRQAATTQPDCLCQQRHGCRGASKRSAPASYAVRDENGELPEDAVRTGPVLDWSWLPIPASPQASAQEWISFDLPAQRQPLPSSLPVSAIFKLCSSGHARRAYVPWLLASESSRLPGQYATYSLRQDSFPPPKKGAKGLQHAEIE